MRRGRGGEEGGWNAVSRIHYTFLNYIGTKLATYLTLVQAQNKYFFLNNILIFFDFDFDLFFL